MYLESSVSTGRASLSRQGRGQNERSQWGLPLCLLSPFSPSTQLALEVWWGPWTTRVGIVCIHIWRCLWCVGYCVMQVRLGNTRICSQWLLDCADTGFPLWLSQGTIALEHICCSKWQNNVFYSSAGRNFPLTASQNSYNSISLSCILRVRCFLFKSSSFSFLSLTNVISYDNVNGFRMQSYLILVFLNNNEDFP